MPTSPYDHISFYVRFLMEIKPDSILDIGLGNGKLGFIARDLLDVMQGQRYRRSEWQIRLDGIEAFGDYIQEHQKAVYDEIHIGDAFDVIDRLGAYDLIVLGDVLEHFPKEKGWLFLDKCFAHTSRAVALFLPLGKGWVQESIYGNPYETHRSCWNAEELIPASCKHALLEFAPGPYGIFLIYKEDYVEHRVRMLKDESFLSAPAEVPNDIKKRYHLNKTAIEAIDLTPLSRYTANEEYKGYFLNTQFREHYRLLAHLGTLFKDQVLFDVGTLKGYSALALSYNPANKIVSYDLEDLKELNLPHELTNIEYCIGNVLADPRLLSAPVILLDTYHDGTFENEFYQHLKNHNYKGLLVLDDIHLNRPMRQFWNSIQEPKEDVTPLGHWSGTGLVDFSIAFQTTP